MNMNMKTRIMTTRRAGAEGAVDLSKVRRWHMPTPMVAENWGSLLLPGLRAAFFHQLDAEVGGAGTGALFNMATSTKSQEQTLGIGGMGDVSVYEGTIEYDAFDPQYVKTFEHVEYAKGLAIERKLVDDDLYNIINQRASLLGQTFGRTRRKHMASVFNNAFTTSLSGDGKALSATDHITSKQRGGAQSNKGTSALTYDSLVATMQLMQAFTDDRGELVTVLPNVLIVPAALESTAWTIVNSMNRPGTANNDGNFIGSTGMSVIVDRYLTDANDWFLADSGLARMHLWWFDRVAAEFAVDPSSDYDLVTRYRGYTRYSFGPDDWRWLYGHSVT